MPSISDNKDFASMGSSGVPQGMTWLMVPEPNPQQYYSAEWFKSWDYMRISVAHLKRVVT